ncbi:MAG: LLM class F420-dependent oxidoreductase [Ardenticatenaceae bacterium]|nr:LLM class F420-dependent oxidoreductase [Ardenticatenaceae bacterium]
MRVGLQLPRFDWPGGPRELRSRLSEIGHAADALGFASLWMMDHFFQLEQLGPVEDPMLESYSTLAYLAAITERVSLGALVGGVIYRYPGILVKTVSTLDVLSGGRAYCGIGAAWYEREAHGLGVPFPPLTERFEQLEEALQIVHQMWSSEVGPYHGKHYQLAETINSPQPLRKPHPPVVIGGMGEQKTLGLVARYADACNLSVAAGPDIIRKKLEVLKHHCEDFGRPYDEIERTALGMVSLAPGGSTPSQVIASCRALAEAGIQHVIFHMPNAHEIAPLETFGREIIPAVAEF